MVSGRSFVANLRPIVTLLLFCGVVLVLASCGGAAPTDVPARPTATIEAVRLHPTRPPRATATAVASLNDEATPTLDTLVDQNPPLDDTPTAIDTTDYALYKSTDGTWSIEYPSSWQTTVSDPNYQFADPRGDIFVQMTYSDMGGDVTNEDLTQLASTQFKTNFTNYVERDQVKQSGGSYRIDFNFDVDDGKGGTVPWDAQAFVEAHQQHLYMLMLATTEDAYEAGTYDQVINHIVTTYVVPSE